MVNLIVADAGPLIGLARIGQLQLPSRLFPTVLITPAVLAECQADPAYPEGAMIAGAVASGWLTIASPPPPAMDWGLDAGETTALQLALACRGGVLMDDRAGRRIATRLEVPVIGLLGLLVLGKRAGKLAALRPLAEQLAGTGYYLGGSLIEDACRRVGE